MHVKRITRVVPAFLAAAATLLGAELAHAGTDNHMNVVIERFHDDRTPGAGFLLLVDVAVPNVAGVTGVTIETPDGVVRVMEIDDDFWNEEREFADLAAVKAAIDGEWTVTVAGANPSVTTFTVSGAALVDGDFFPTPTMITPTSGATGVAADVVFEWTDPTGAATHDVLLIDVDDQDEFWQEATSLDGSIALDATTWDPPADISDGQNEFAVMYLAFDSARGTAYNVASGTIDWGVSPFAPVGYPVGRPLFAVGAERIVLFEVGDPVVACIGDLDGSNAVDFADLLAVLVSWGPCIDCPADLDGNGVVGFSDLLTILVGWGPCKG